MGKKPFYLYGRRPVREFFRAGTDLGLVRKVYLAENFPVDFRRQYLSELPATIFDPKPRRDLDRISGGENHQGIILELSGRPAENALAGGWKEVFRSVPEDAGPVVVLDRIQDPHNLGSIIRSSEALGARCVFVTGKGAPLSSSVVDRVSAGATLHLPVFEQGGLAGVLKFARENEFWVVAAAGDSPEADQTRQIDFAGIAELPPASRLVLLIGNEGEGLKKSLLDGADYVIGIPLRGKIDSLNAGVAAGILIERLIHR